MTLDRIPEKSWVWVAMRATDIISQQVYLMGTRHFSLIESFQRTMLVRKSFMDFFTLCSIQRALVYYKSEFLKYGLTDSSRFPDQHTLTSAMVYLDHYYRTAGMLVSYYEAGKVIRLIQEGGVSMIRSFDADYRWAHEVKCGVESL